MTNSKESSVHNQLAKEPATIGNVETILQNIVLNSKKMLKTCFLYTSWMLLAGPRFSYRLMWRPSQKDYKAEEFAPGRV